MKLPAGGYVCRIIKAENARTKKGKFKLMLQLDIAEGEYKGYFRKLHEQLREYNPTANYPCIYHCAIDSLYFGELMKAIEASNEDEEITKSELKESERNANVLRRLLVGMVFGDVEYETRKGEITTIAQPRRPKSIEQIHNGKFRIPTIQKMSDRRRF